MNPPDRRRAAPALLLALAMLLPGLVTAQGDWPTPPNPQDAGNTMNWKTHCVGRVMMNLPDDQPLIWTGSVDVGELKRLQPMSEQQFWDGVEVVRSRYMAQKHDDAPTRLAHFEKVSPGGALIFYYDNSASFWGPVLERYAYLDRDHAYELRTKAIATRGQPPSPSLFQPFVQKYAPILSRIHPLAAGQFPDRDGLCIDGAVVSGDTGRNASAGLISEIAFGSELAVTYLENNYQVALYSGFEDLKFDEDHAKNPMGYDGPDAFKDFAVLRKRDRILGGIAGQEFVTRTLRKDGHVYYRMVWTVKGALNGGVLKPTIAVHLNTPKTALDVASGKPYDKLPPEPELLKLWDYALSTFKWRAGALPDGQQIEAVN